MDSITTWMNPDLLPSVDDFVDVAERKRGHRLDAAMSQHARQQAERSITPPTDTRKDIYTFSSGPANVMTASRFKQVFSSKSLNQAKTYPFSSLLQATADHTRHLVTSLADLVSAALLFVLHFLTCLLWSGWRGGSVGRG